MTDAIRDCDALASSGGGNLVSSPQCGLGSLGWGLVGQFLSQF